MKRKDRWCKRKGRLIRNERRQANTTTSALTNLIRHEPCLMNTYNGPLVHWSSIFSNIQRWSPRNWAWWENDEENRSSTSISNHHWWWHAYKWMRRRTLIFSLMLLYRINLFPCYDVRRITTLRRSNNANEEKCQEKLDAYARSVYIFLARWLRWTTVYCSARYAHTERSKAILNTSRRSHLEFSSEVNDYVIQTQRSRSPCINKRWPGVYIHWLSYLRTFRWSYAYFLLIPFKGCHSNVRSNRATRFSTTRGTTTCPPSLDAAKKNKLKHDITWEMKRQKQQQKHDSFSMTSDSSHLSSRMLSFRKLSYVGYAHLNVSFFSSSSSSLLLLFAQANNYLAIIIKIKWMRW